MNKKGKMISFILAASVATIMGGAIPVFADTTSTSIVSVAELHKIVGVDHYATAIAMSKKYPAAAKVISTNEQLTAAINDQADGQTWIIKKGTYDLPRGTKIIEGQAGWYLPITANNLTIIGENNPTLTSLTSSVNGAWASQNFITVFGNDVKISGVTLKTKEEANKVIEVIGDNFTLDNAIITPNTYNFAGSIYFSNAGKTATISNTILNYGRISGLSGATGATINLNNVDINFAGATDSDDYNVEKAYWAYYRDNSSNTAATVNANKLEVTMSNAMGSDLQDAINMLPGGTKVVLEKGEYYNSTGEAPTTPTLVKLVTKGAKFLKADKIISSIEELTTAINTQVADQTWIINKGTYTLTGENVIYTAPELGGFFGVITANNITIKGVGNPIINSNGNTGYTGTFMLKGNNVTVEGINFQPNQQNPNRTVDIVGTDATVKDCKFTIDGALYIQAEANSGSLGTLTITGNTFTNNMICLDSADTASSIIISNNTFNMGASNAYAIGNVSWTTPARTTMATVTVKNNIFNTNSTGMPIIRNRMTGTFNLNGNTIDGARPSNWNSYILLQNDKFSTPTNPTVNVDGRIYSID